MRILVLVGGTSAERDVSLATGQAVIEALRERGHEVLAIDTADGRRLLDIEHSPLIEGVAAMPPETIDRVTVSDELTAALALPEVSGLDVVFLALHGGEGEDGHIQALLDLAGIPYTGSGMAASALAMNKHQTKTICRTLDIPTADWLCLPSESAPTPKYEKLVDWLGEPFVVKPNEQGSTVGLSIVETEDEYAPALKEAFRHGGSVLIERFIPGRELTAAILGGEALPIVEIIPEHGIYDYECKYTSGKSNYVCPAEITAQQTESLQAYALKIYTSIECSGYGRIDFRMRQNGEFYCLEVNTLPGMTSTSLVPKAAAAAGIGFAELVEKICDLAIIRSAD